MTQEEKAKAYDEALERAKQFSEHPLLEDSANIVEYIFPELKESEDERIRKEILNVFKQLDEDTTLCGRNYDYAKWIDWLEKQDEQNLANSAKTCKKSQRMISAEAKEALYSKPEDSLLDKALDFIVEREESNDYICEKMSEFSDEWDYCWNNCQNLQKECVIRFLKHYENNQV